MFTEFIYGELVYCLETADHPDQTRENRYKPLGYAPKADRHPAGHERGLDKRQTTLYGVVTGLIRGFGRGKGYFVGGNEASPHAPELSAEESPIPLSTPSHMFQSPLKPA